MRDSFVIGQQPMGCFAGCQLCVALDRNGDWVFSEKNFWVGFVFEACLHTLTSPHHLAKGGEGVARLAKRGAALGSGGKGRLALPPRWKR